MAVIKCKMCGGDLNIIEGASTAECEYCGSIQTIPKVDDEKKLTLFARANRLRAACEFDKAAGIYESIVADFPEEAEAYWGLVLCKYGIEYVDDPATGKKIPTCHRSSFDSVMEDENFEQTLENADAVARRVYREEAKQIEELRKGIIEVSAKEAPYDIFICYKETAEDGNRTLDSVLAHDIYDALTDKGYRVFFSRITLEDKLGQEYEPYIFAALNSARIMLAVGTDYEYFNAVWVKNEWSRYLQLMAKDKSKHLIPCFKGLDAYDMPKEFARLQAQDLGKVGAMQDLLRGIEKILPKAKPAQTVVQERVVVGGRADTEALLKRVFMFLEDGNWEAADEYCEKVLDIEPECGEAYLGKLMAKFHLHKTDDFVTSHRSFAEEKNFQKATRYADEKTQRILEEYHGVLEEYHGTIDKLSQKQQSRIDRHLAERKEKLYRCAVEYIRKQRFEKAIVILKQIAGYKDTDVLLSDIKKDIFTAYACVSVGGKWGYIDETGKTVFQLQVNSAGTFTSNGLAPVCVGEKWGYIDEAGRTVIPPQFDGAEPFGANGLACVKVGKKWGYVNEAGEMVIQPQFDKQFAEGAWTFCTNGLALVKVGNKYGYINEAGEMVGQLQFDDANLFAVNGLACVKVGGKWGYINEVGEMVIQPQFSWADSFAANGLACVGVGNELGYIDETGKMVIPPQSHGAGSFGPNGLAPAQMGKKYGYMNEAGEMTIPLQFDDTVSFSANGLAPVMVGTKWGYIDESGEVVVQPQFDEEYIPWSDEGIRRLDDNCLIPMAVGGKWGYVNGVGQIVVQPQFDSVESFDANGLARVKVGGKWGYINEAGEMVIQPRFDHAEGFAIIWRSKVEKQKSFTRMARESADRADQDEQLRLNHLAQRRRLAAIAKSRISVSPNFNYPLHMGLSLEGNVFLSGEDKYRNAAKDWQGVSCIAMGEFHALALNIDGGAYAVGDNQYGQCNVAGWNNLVAVAAGGWHSVGLRADGTVVATGLDEYNECQVSSWKDIKKVCAGKRHTVGLRKDGTVVATGFTENGRCEVSRWTNIVDIFAFNAQTIGLKADGTVLSAGGCYAVKQWTNIVDISMGYECILGLKKDGTVVFATKNDSISLNIAEWTDIVDISVKNLHALGLRADGTVVAAGLNQSGQCDVQQWNNIVAVSAGDFCSLGLRKDGSVIKVGDSAKQPYTKTASWKLFSNIENFEEEHREAVLKAAERRKEQMRQQPQWRNAGLCQHCGGQLKGLFTKKCVNCGKPKDY